MMKVDMPRTSDNKGGCQQQPGTEKKSFNDTMIVALGVVLFLGFVWLWVSNRQEYFNLGRKEVKDVDNLKEASRCFLHACMQSVHHLYINHIHDDPQTTVTDRISLERQM
jgi:hypothetical protein